MAARGLREHPYDESLFPEQRRAAEFPELEEIRKELNVLVRKFGNVTRM